MNLLGRRIINRHTGQQGICCRVTKRGKIMGLRESER